MGNCVGVTGTHRNSYLVGKGVFFFFFLDKVVVQGLNAIACTVG